MKKLALLVVVFLSLVGYSQGCFDPNWNWENPKEWKVYYPDGVFNYSPYTNLNSADIKTIIEGDDLKK
ncbi:hypothetical protein [Aquimarina agarilytica]|uniref:hypothetical protein n=1 Tax=Aquimarina agarilytica TaxID=1087449 RepID=UPI000287AEC2|nr:hypothetical protein [Aquimarina agarilytica]